MYFKFSEPMDWRKRTLAGTAVDFIQKVHLLPLRMKEETPCPKKICTRLKTRPIARRTGTPAPHVMAQAVKRLYPQVKLAIGPSIDSGWYYDF